MSASGQSINQVKDTIRKLLNLASDDVAAYGSSFNADSSRSSYDRGSRKRLT